MAQQAVPQEKYSQQLAHEWSHCPRPGGGGVLPYNSYTGMCRPKGSYFWDSDLKRGIIFKPFSGTGYNFSNARKLQNVVGDFNNRTGY